MQGIRIMFVTLCVYLHSKILSFDVLLDLNLLSGHPETFSGGLTDRNFIISYE